MPNRAVHRDNEVVRHGLQKSYATGIGKETTVTVFKVKSILNMGSIRPANWTDIE